MTLEERFEAKRQELARVEQREAFLRGQLEEAVQARLRLVGQLEMLQELYKEQQAEAATPTLAPEEEMVNGRDHA